mmetsp:Transcript_5713/g.15748  ORF Transcript_5713/g.15748 Transcript_5713/m.15748 type:complete len:141 (+) Transcript_5713:417-839(+)
MAAALRAIALEVVVTFASPAKNQTATACSLCTEVLSSVQRVAVQEVVSPRPCWAAAEKLLFLRSRSLTSAGTHGRKRRQTWLCDVAMGRRRADGANLTVRLKIHRWNNSHSASLRLSSHVFDRPLTLLGSTLARPAIIGM